MDNPTKSKGLWLSLKDLVEKLAGRRTDSAQGAAKPSSPQTDISAYCLICKRITWHKAGRRIVDLCACRECGTMKDLDILFLRGMTKGEYMR